MATRLYWLGKFAYRHKWWLVSVWVLLLIGAGLGAKFLSGPTSDAFEIPGTPAEQAQTLLAERFPAAEGSRSINAPYEQIVFQAPAGTTLRDPANAAAMSAVIAKIDSLGQVVNKDQLADPVTAADATIEMATAQGVTEENARALAPLSADQTIGYTQVDFSGEAAGITDATRTGLDQALQIGRDQGLNVQMTGSAAAPSTSIGNSEIFGLVVAALVLVLTFGSLVAAGLPLLTALVGIGIAALCLMAATGIFELSATTPALAIMLGLAVAIDYALFIVSRYKHERMIGEPGEEAAGRALGTAGSAVVFAGITVIIALLALRVVNIPFLSAMGYAAAFAVAIAVLIALTLLPALLGVFGRKVFAGAVPLIGNVDPEGEQSETTNGERWIRLVRRSPALFLLVGVAVLVVIALPATHLRLGLPNDTEAAVGSTERAAVDLLAEGFGPGVNGRLLVVVDGADAKPSGPAAFVAVASAISALPNVQNAQLIAVDQGFETAQILVTPTTGPGSAETVDLVDDIRAAEPALAAQTGASFGVTGRTAVDLDVSNQLQSSLLPYLAIVVGLAFFLLIMVFRSILVPLTATLGFLLSIAATFGAVVAVFQDGRTGWIDNPAPIVSFIPIFLIGVVFGLAMDYQVFLVTRMSEEHVHGASPGDAVQIGFRHGARVVTAAAAIMIAVFGSFMLGENPFIKLAGFGLAVAVVFDAFLVRMMIIPAVMCLLGKWMWWLPRRIAPLVPHVDVEGERLRKMLAETGDPL